MRDAEESVDGEAVLENTRKKRASARAGSVIQGLGSELKASLDHHSDRSEKMLQTMLSTFTGALQHASAPQPPPAAGPHGSVHTHPGNTLP